MKPTGPVLLDMSDQRNVPLDQWRRAVGWAAAETYRVTRPHGLGVCRLYAGESARAYDDIVRLYREAGWHYLLTVGQTADGLTESFSCEAGAQWTASALSFGAVLFTKQPLAEPWALQETLARAVAALEEEWVTVKR
jgi:hypothetical protein